METFILTHDVGTSSVKSSLVNEKGAILNSCTLAYPTEHRFVGWAEQMPEDWWKAVCANTAALCRGIPYRAIAGVSLTGQMMCALPVGRDGSILHPAIIWSDSRAEAQWKTLADRLGEEKMYQLTGMKGSPNYALPKMMWFRDVFPERYDKTAVFLSPKDYINYRLTGRFVTDPENAAYMYCYDRQEKRWSDDLLLAAGIDRGKLPEIVSTGEILGPVCARAGEECSLAPGTPVVMGIGDGGAATIGSGVIEPGNAYTSLGTSSWVCAISGGDRTGIRPTEGISQLDYLDRERLSGTMQAGGYSLSWLADTLFPLGKGPTPEAERFAQINALAKGSPPGSQGVLFLPYLFGERAPLWDTRLRGALLGLSGTASRGDLCRAVMEGVGLHLGWILGKIQSQGAEITEMRLVGGGAKSPVWQGILADIYGIPVSTVAHPGQSAALGLAVLAGVSLGIFPELNEIRNFQTTASTVLPNAENHAFYGELGAIFRHSATAVQSISHELDRLREHYS